MLKTLGILHAAGYVRRLVTNRPILALLKEIVMTQKELADKLDTLTAQAVKVGDEIKALQVLVANTDNVPQAIVDKVGALGAAIQADDDLAPDAPPAA